jgi:hypothetical protein
MRRERVVELEVPEQMRPAGARVAIRQGRSIARRYLGQNPDVAAVLVNPLTHDLQVDASEGRTAFSDRVRLIGA